MNVSVRYSVYRCICQDHTHVYAYRTSTGLPAIVHRRRRVTKRRSCIPLARQFGAGPYCSTIVRQAYSSSKYPSMGSCANASVVWFSSEDPACRRRRCRAPLRSHLKRSYLKLSVQETFFTVTITLPSRTCLATRHPRWACSPAAGRAYSSSKHNYEKHMHY